MVNDTENKHSFLKLAQALAMFGFKIFPVKANSKLPAVDDFTGYATDNLKKLEEYWTAVGGGEYNYNIGIATTNFGEGEALIVVDVDNKDGKNGDEEILKLELEGKEFPQTFTQLTPSGGKHLVYRSKAPVKQGTDVLGKGLDIRSRGGFIVGWGSKINGKLYKRKQMDSIAECPQWIIDACGVETEAEVFDNAKAIDSDTTSLRAKDYLQNQAPLAVEGSGGDATTFKVACRMKDFGCSTDLALELMSDYWNENCQPPWAINDLKTKIDHAYKYGANSMGSLAPENDFTKIEDDGKEKSYLHKLNEEFALLFEDGGHAILQETVDEKGRPKVKFMTEASFKRMFSPKLVGEGRKAKSYAEIWLDWKSRREFKGLCFKPEQLASNGYYNLWRGFTVSAQSYDTSSNESRMGFDMFMEHAEKNVCGGDKELFEWLMGYFAHMIQRPWERPLTTIVFRGSKGVGKNAVIDRIGKLLGSGHYLVAHDGRYLTSNFNGHLDSCLCLVLDEAFWSGDKSAEGKLKGITTQEEIMIERKGKEPYQVDNLARLVVIGNEDWLVPASFDERRYAVFDVGEGRKQDQNFFETMRILMDEKGGLSILIDYLKKFDLSKVNVNKAPNTEALMEQKIASLDPFDQFWFDCLMEGHVIGFSEFGSDWPSRVPKNAFRKAISDNLKERGVKQWAPSAVALGKRVRALSPTANANAKMKAGEVWVNCYEFQPIETCRTEWEARMGAKVKWPKS